ncbi:MAG: hypothetical protein SPI74_04535 [Eubacterium sp.]|nr:hypothetical protein [Eubacterium sp.]
MLLLRAVILLLSLFMGVFFTLFILTAIEAKSPKFENFSRRVHESIPVKIWLALFLCTLILVPFLFYKFTSFEYVRMGIFSGLFAGFFLYFKSGPNIDREEMEREAQRKGGNPTGILNFFQGPDKRTYNKQNKTGKKPAKPRPGKLKDKNSKNKR